MASCSNYTTIRISKELNNLIRSWLEKNETVEDRVRVFIDLDPRPKKDKRKGRPEKLPWWYE
jgi:hypothetical protein